MTKYTLFAVQNNVLVYRNTGKVYQKGYEIKGHTVYSKKTGRKIGTIGKPTATQKRKIQRASENRQKKLRKEVRKFGTKRTDTLGSEDLATIGQVRESLGFPLSKQQVSLQNFAMLIEQGKQDGKLTEEEGNAFLNRYLDARNDTERSKIWKELLTLYKERDIPPSL